MHYYHHTQKHQRDWSTIRAHKRDQSTTTQLLQQRYQSKTRARAQLKHNNTTTTPALVLPKHNKSMSAIKAQQEHERNKGNTAAATQQHERNSTSTSAALILQSWLIWLHSFGCAHSHKLIPLHSFSRADSATLIRLCGWFSCTYSSSRAESLLPTYQTLEPQPSRSRSKTSVAKRTKMAPHKLPTKQRNLPTQPQLYHQQKGAELALIELQKTTCYLAHIDFANIFNGDLEDEDI